MVSCIPAISISAVKSGLSDDRESRSLIFETRSRKYMEDGNKIELKKVASYFGLLSLAIASNLKPGHIQATVLCDSELVEWSCVYRITLAQRQKRSKAVSTTPRPRG